MTDSQLPLTSEMAEALRRASSDPDLFSGDFEYERDQRVYAPLVRLGLLTMTVKPWPANELYEIVHYETTEIGKWALRLYDKHCAERPAD